VLELCGPSPMLREWRVVKDLLWLCLLALREELSFQMLLALSWSALVKSKVNSL